MPSFKFFFWKSWIWDNVHISSIGKHMIVFKQVYDQFDSAKKSYNITLDVETLPLLFDFFIIRNIRKRGKYTRPLEVLLIAFYFGNFLVYLTTYNFGRSHSSETGSGTWLLTKNNLRKTENSYVFGIIIIRREINTN